MINHISVTEGYAAELEHVKNVTFSFGPGLNVLFGPNGCGKSSLLRIMAGYAGCGNGGWTNLRGHDGYLYDFDFNVKKFPADVKVAGGNRATMDWDGSPAYLSETSKEDAPIHQFGVTGMDMLEEVSLLVAKPSDGQRRLCGIGRTFEAVKNGPPKRPEKMKDTEKLFYEHVDSLPKTGPMTLLLDEPERNLSIESQAVFLAGLVNWATQFQVILATHSALIVNRLPENANLVDFVPGYYEHSKKMLGFWDEGKTWKEMVDYLKEKEAPKPKRRKKG